MRIPRDTDASRLLKALQKLGYEVIRQKGSHIRLAYTGEPKHFITVPNHNPIKIGTLNHLINEISSARSISPYDLITML